MGVGMAFLRKKNDGTWEGDYERLGRGEFGELQDLIFSLRKPLLYFLSYREDEYDIGLNWHSRYAPKEPLLERALWER